MPKEPEKKLPIAITFDLDWAPDWAIQICIDICETYSVPATFFVTHDADILADLRKNANMWELGLHPNFQGKKNSESVYRHEFSNLKKIVPEAESMRTHGLVQSSNMLRIAHSEFDIKTDSSLFLPFIRHAEPILIYYEDLMSPLLRLPFTFEDDVYFNWPDQNWNATFSEPENLWILAFHPIHIALNSKNGVNYQKLVSSLEKNTLQNVTQRGCEKYINSTKPGARTLLENILRENVPLKETKAFSSISQIRKSFFKNEEDHSSIYKSDQISKR